MCRQAEEDAAVDVGAPRKKPTLEGPPLDRTARDVARPDRKAPRPTSALDDRIQVLRQVRAVGVHLQEELRAIRAGLKVIEVPITFVERVHGTSKMSRAVVAEALWRVTVWGITGRRRGSGPAKRG